ncbi:MAG: hypothetical protein O7B25_13395 [Gammaproteobacteria bacterium]|nr:hypothetical protein [Gammaproteobacteria bacterium]
MNWSSNSIRRDIGMRWAVTLGLLMLALFGLSAGLQADLGSAPRYIASSDKGGFQYSEPSTWPELELDLGPIEQQVAQQASTRCGTALAAEPLMLGDAASVMEKMMGKAASAAMGKLIGGLLGGGGRSNKKPNLFKDPIKKKYKKKFDHPTGAARIQLGGRQYADGLLLSARVDKAKGKGTFHTMFLEKPDCTRIWPVQYLGYRLWGSWSLSVSVTKTTSTYRDGKLVDRDVSKSGWSKSGNFDFSRGFSLWDDVFDDELRLILDPDEAYLAQLRREIGNPAWREMGYGEPTEGIRSAGGLFKLQPEELTSDTIAVIHITEVKDGRYQTLGFPLKFVAGEEGLLSFELLDPPII